MSRQRIDAVFASGELVRRVRRARREPSVGALRQAPPRLHSDLGGLQEGNQK